MAELDVDDVAILIPCERCGAASGDWCVTKGGAQATWLHTNDFKGDEVSKTWLLSTFYKIRRELVP